MTNTETHGTENPGRPHGLARLVTEQPTQIIFTVNRSTGDILEISQFVVLN